LPLVTRQYIKFLSDKAYGREKSTEVSALENDKLTAEADYKRAKARMAQLSLNELDGKLHRAEDVEAVLTNLIYAIRGTLLALPGRLAADTARCKTAAQAADCIKAEVYAALREVSKFRYDKEEFKGRVKERQGWESEPLENDEP
jgi:phage terminase Nu1 subunit (DNA packaging protein)